MGIARLGAAALVLLALTSCQSAAPEPTSSPTTVPEAPSPSPTPEGSGIATIVLAADGLDLLDDGGSTVEELGWFDDSATTIATLTDAFGEEPAEFDYEGNIESAPGVDYTWGDDAFVLRVQDFEAEAPLTSNQTVIVKAAAVGEVAIEGPEGVAVGDPASDAASAPAWGEPFEGDDGHTVQWVKLDTVSPGDGPEENYTTGIIDLDDDVVVQLQAPAANYGV
ncbi:hypothetical protein [Homoserinibacter sp. YIM 151385]|uniref:hypothetical protein n=1 Tax=Homoserinibacter sp. YIM 151385 TaxID=2985506 RepID=UPI0022F0A14A|nr:hypothetical protein [Homoserinibacter sp. YIM 151385]WBU38091.1 hypothetical protein OF852_00475 [Homoserinibacter sp. YIM 151385]